ncbi:GDP-mannose 4,6-dehydratase [Anaerolineales bacterium]
MTYLVTGGAGFIGSYLAEALLKQGESVVIIDNFNDYYDPAIKRNNIKRLADFSSLEVIEGDIRNAKLINSIYESQNISHVAHLAALAGVRSSIKETPAYIDVNLIGTMNLLEAARDYDIKQFVLASTSSVYGETQRLPFNEEDLAAFPLASYPASKRSAEILAYTYHHLNKLNVNILRFFNVYGPAGRPDMMPMRLMHAALDGSEIPLFNKGDFQRDWTYIDDTVKGVIEALHRPLGYEIMNLGVGQPISLKDFIEIIEELSGRTINTRNVEAPPSDPPITFCDNTKAKELLGFAPSISVSEGLKRTWDWFIKYNDK